MVFYPLSLSGLSQIKSICNGLGKDYNPNVYKPFLGVRRRYLETAFGVIREKHGTIDAYLADSLGVYADLRDTLVARLVGQG